MSSMRRKLDFEPILAHRIATTGAMGHCKTLTAYAKGLYYKNEISIELYTEFLNFIVPLCLEKMVEDKFNEIIPKWNKRFDNWLYSNLEEAT